MSTTIQAPFAALGGVAAAGIFLWLGPESGLLHVLFVGVPVVGACVADALRGREPSPRRAASHLAGNHHLV